MKLDWDTLNNLKTHKDAWVGMLERQKLLSIESLNNTEFEDDAPHTRVSAIEAETSYIDHELRVMKVTLDQAEELLALLKDVEPLLRLILERDQ